MAEENLAARLGMDTPDTKVHTSIPAHSMAAMSNDQLVDAHNHAPTPDPLAGKLRMSGVADPRTYSQSLKIGDRFYHKEKKKEGKIVDLSASGKAQVAFDDGRTGTVLQSNLIKL